MLDVLLVEERIRNLIKPFMEQSGLDLVELNCRRQGREITLKILADRPLGGITIEECSLLNRNIVKALDEEKLMGEDYSLEVSSPGLDRPLKTLNDFKRVVGAEIRFFLTTPLEGTCEHVGILKEVHEDSLVVDKPKKTALVISSGQILKGLQVI